MRRRSRTNVQGGLSLSLTDLVSRNCRGSVNLQTDSREEIKLNKYVCLLRLVLQQEYVRRISFNQDNTSNKYLILHQTG